MQIPSTNSGHDQSSHQITECIHPHSYRHERTGASASSMTKTQDPQQLLQEASKEEGFSLSAWMKKMMGGGKSILGAIWGGGSDSASSTQDGLSQGGEEQVMAQIGYPDAADHGQNTHTDQLDQLSAHSARIAAASTMAKIPIQQETSYFSIQSPEEKERNLWEKVKVKFHSVAGYLTRQFSGQNTFQTQQEPAREDLRRHSHFRGENEEIDCVLTDDTYLLDSYDRRGEYTRLTTKNR